MPIRTPSKVLRTCTETSSTRGERAKERERARERGRGGPHRKVSKWSGEKPARQRERGGGPARK